MSITLRNSTDYIAQFVIKKGGLVIARLPGLAPQAQIDVPTNNTYTVIASTILDDNTYTSAPSEINSGPESGQSFLAQVLQNQAQGTYEFNVEVSPSPVANQMIFQKTCLNPVTFSVQQENRTLQNVVVSDSFSAVSLSIDDTYHVYAIINGITTETFSTSSASATITAIDDSSSSGAGYFTLTFS